MNRFDFFHYNFHYDPRKESEEACVVSDWMGYIYAKDFDYCRQTFYNNQVIFIIEGTMYLEQYGKKYTLKAGQGVLLKLTDAHHYYTDPVDIAHVLWFHFRGKPTQPLMDRLGSFGKLPLLFSSDTLEEKIYRCFEVTRRHAQEFEYRLSPLLYEMILDIAKNDLQEIEATARCASTFVNEVREYVIGSIYLRRIDLDTMCKRFCMSKSYFSARFTAEFQMSPMRYVTTIRINEVKNLLASTDQSIETIAHALFFADQSHLSKVFKTMVGISPHEYRKIIREEK